MTLRRTILITSLIVASFSLVIAVLYVFAPNSLDTPTGPQEQRSTAPYTVKSYQGYVAVFTDDTETPSEITGTPVSLLPLQDQLDLAEGIPVHSKAALSALLEDYCS